MSCGFSDVVLRDGCPYCPVCDTYMDEWWLVRALAYMDQKQFKKLNPKLWEYVHASVELQPSKHV